MKKKFTNVIDYICWFCLLFYPFNETIINKIYPNMYVLCISIFIPIFYFMIRVKFYKIRKNQIVIFVITIIVILFQYINNYYLMQGRILKSIFFSCYLLLPFILSFNDENIIKSFKRVIKIFLFEHVLGTIFVQVFRTTYYNTLIPWIADGRAITLKLLYVWHKSGYNAGITAHYSTNGIYLSIAVIYFFSEYVHKNSKKNIIFSIVSFIALLLTGKRAQFLFTIVSCVIIYIYYNRRNISKKIIGLCIGIMSIIILLYISSMFIPGTLNVVKRFEEANKSGDILNGRDVFYETCIDSWKKKPIFGNGWGFFSEYYENNIYNSNSASHNIEYLDAHNVYLQILCETGIIGFIFFISLMLGLIYKNYKYIQYKYANNSEMLLFSLGYQIFFAFYCFSGNPLYDVQCYSLYFILVGMVLIEEKIIYLKESEGRKQ